MSVKWLAADWPAPAGVVAGCTLRNGGVSAGPYRSLNLGAHVGDEAARVRENRRRLVAAAGLPAEPRWLTQVHGCQAVVDPAPDTEADAAVSSRPGVVCAVMIADCLPVLLAAGDGSVIAAAHAGWRGLAAGVIERTVEAMQSAPAGMVAWLGPAISQAAFEVGEEVRAAFVDHDEAAAGCFSENDRGRFMADLFALARQRLSACGVRNVHGGGRCTYSEPESFFSYRRDGQCGRLAAFVFRRPQALEMG